MKLLKPGVYWIDLMTKEAHHDFANWVGTHTLAVKVLRATSNWKLFEVGSPTYWPDDAAFPPPTRAPRGKATVPSDTVQRAEPMRDVLWSVPDVTDPNAPSLFSPLRGIGSGALVVLGIYFLSKR